MQAFRRAALQVIGSAALLVACSSDTGKVAGLGGMPGSGATGAGSGQAGGAGRAAAGGAVGGSAGRSAPGAGRAGTSAGGSSGTASGVAGNAAAGGAGKAAGGNGGRTSSGSGGAGGSAGRANGGTAGDDAGNAGEGDGAGAGDTIPDGYVKAIIGVGYGGIRIVSRDEAKHWGDRVSDAAEGGDDDDLLRAVTYGKGRWVATGWKLVTSDDGLHWTDHGKFEDGILDNQKIIEGLAYANGYFYGSGDHEPARIYRSPDGVSWSAWGEIGDLTKHVGLTFRAGVFVAYDDSKTSYQSTDGKAWTDMHLDEATYCESAWKTLTACHDSYWSGDGYYIYPEWGGDIMRSSDGQDFESAYADEDQHNTLYRQRAVAEGYVAPE